MGERETFAPYNPSRMSDKILLALVDDPLLQQPIKSACAQLGYAVEFGQTVEVEDRVGYLVAKQPWLVIFDLNVESSDWHAFITTAKTSPATRKIPFLAVGPESNTEILRAAKKAGCDAVISHQSFLADPAGAIAKYSKSDDSAELLRQAQLPLPALVRTAIEQFNQHEFFEQHETFETAWRAESGPVRQMYQGILQVGVAYLQIQRKNYAGARKLFQRAWQYLNVLPAVCQGVDIAQFRADAHAAQAEMERLGPERIVAFDVVFFKPIQIKSSQ